MYDGIIDGDAIIPDLEELCSYDTNLERAFFMQYSFEGMGLDVSLETIDYGDRDDINVYATYTGDKDSSDYLIIGAHHDKVEISPGANDNGTGSVALIEMARQYIAREEPINIMFASYGMEELGLIGSAQHAQGLSETEKEKIVGMINLDTIGNGPYLALITEDSYSETDPWMNEIIINTADNMDIELKPINVPFASSDQSSYMEVGVRATFLCRIYERGVPDIHTPEDKVEKIKPEEVAEVADLAYVSALSMYENRFE